MSGEREYVVEVKPSARKANGAVGRLVNREGPRRTFPDRRSAEAWAEGLSEGSRPVWIRAAHPQDRSEVDGYLVSRRRQLLDLDGAYDKRRRRLRDTDAPVDTLGNYDG
ncbi:hypothetical protein RYH80_08610 [Halobaculum sp. MBLA0147]|uniref:hypothetical protein n=1 Tax=Halobaculum sp. MBLA0147 TaxID=3079934 RepID=UPI0035253CE3